MKRLDKYKDLLLKWKKTRTVNFKSEDEVRELIDIHFDLIKPTRKFCYTCKSSIPPLLNQLANYYDVQLRNKPKRATRNSRKKRK